MGFLIFENGFEQLPGSVVSQLHRPFDAVIVGLYGSILGNPVAFVLGLDLRAEMKFPSTKLCIPGVLDLNFLEKAAGLRLIIPKTILKKAGVPTTFFPYPKDKTLLSEARET